ncbi:uracil nucleotide/cysteinyl leukotriene receptor-like, partial [Scleropages formosus]
MQKPAVLQLNPTSSFSPGAAMDFLRTTSAPGTQRVTVSRAAVNLTVTENVTGADGCEGERADFQYVLLPVVYSVVFVLAMAGNVTALVHFVRSRSAGQPSHIFLVNLCAIDLLFALTLPFNVVYHAGRNHWPFGEVMCKANGALFFGNLYGSSLFLMLISLDRYLAVSHPMRALRLRQPKYRVLLSCLVRAPPSRRHDRAVPAATVGALTPFRFTVWLILLSIILYLTARAPMTRRFPSTGHMACMENFSSGSWRGRLSAVSLLSAALGFFLPLLGDALSGSRRMRRRALRMVLLVLGVFLLCFTPYHLNQLLHTLGRMGALPRCPVIRFTYPARRVAMALCSLN